jgi:hypothetical protein
VAHTWVTAPLKAFHNTHKGLFLVAIVLALYSSLLVGDTASTRRSAVQSWCDVAQKLQTEMFLTQQSVKVYGCLSICILDILCKHMT